MNNKLKYFLLPSELKSRFSFDDYLYYRLQKKTKKEIKEFLNLDELWETEARLNNDAFRKIFNSKRVFYETFNKYLGRDYLILSDYDEEAFQKFFNDHEKCVLKPDDMYAGLGIIICDNTSSIPIPFDELKKKNYILEEYINANEAYQKIYPKCLNTVRVTTFIDKDGNSSVLFCANQFGSRGSLVDNNDETAIWGICDTETGIIIYPDIDELSGRIYDKHPDTNVELIGFKNPFWNEIKNLAIRASYIVPQCRLVGWDIAVTKNNKIIIIEGNVTPELDLYQRLTGCGLKKLLEG